MVATGNERRVCSHVDLDLVVEPLSARALEAHVDVAEAHAARRDGGAGIRVFQVPGDHTLESTNYCLVETT